MTLSLPARPQPAVVLVQETVYLADRVAVTSCRPRRILRTFRVPFRMAERSPDLRSTPEFAEAVGEVSHTLREGHAR